MKRLPPLLTKSLGILAVISLLGYGMKVVIENL